MIRIAILDDYQNPSLEMADWSPLAGRAVSTVFNDHLSNFDKAVERLTAVRCGLRHARAHTTATVSHRALAATELIASTGPRNAAIHVGAAAERGIAVARMEYDARSHHRDDLGSHPCERASGRIGKGRHTGKEPNRLR